MKHPTIFGVRMEKTPGAAIYTAVAGLGTAFRLTATLRLEGDRWFGELRLNGVRVHEAKRGLRTLAAASDSLASAATELNIVVDSLCNGHAVGVATY